MLKLAYRQIVHDLTRSGLTVLAISTAIAVILILRGFEQGLYVQAETTVLDRGGQLILTQSGVSNYMAVRSSLPQLTREQVEAIEGVDIAHPMTGFWVICGPDGNKSPLLLLVYDTLGGPTHLIEGNPISDGRDIVVDIGFSKKYDMKPGDPLIISDFEFTISGITSHSSALFSAIAFVTYDGMIDLFLESEIAPDISTFPLLSFLLVELNPTADVQQVSAVIENKIPKVDVFLPEVLAKNDVALGEELFGPIMKVLIYLAYVIGMLVVGMIIYSDVSARRRTFAVMKALGFSRSKIMTAVMVQTLLLVIVAYPLGVLIALLAGYGIEWNAPVYLVHILDLAGLLYVFSGVIVMMVLGSLLPLRLIASADPVIAFQVE